MKRILIFILSIFAFAAYAQEDSDCSKTLKKAQLVYDAGEIEKVEQMLVGCLENGFSSAEKTSALELIILVNLFEDDIPNAELNMIDLLSHNPDYTPKGNAHQEIKELYSKFRTDPLLIIDYTAGVNFTEANVLRYYTLNYNSPFEKNYSPQLGFNFGITANYLLTKGFRANGGAHFKNQNFGISELFGFDGSDLEVDEHQKIEASVSTSQIGFQTGISKEFGRKKFVPHAGLGTMYDIYLNSFHQIERGYVNNDQSIGNVQGPRVDSKNLLNGNNLSVFADLGFRYKIGVRGKIIFSVKTSLGLINQTNTENRYLNPELVYNYYYLPDDYLLHNMSLNIGYSQLIYKPKKLK